MKRVYLFVEGSTDKVFLQRILRTEELQDVEIVVSDKRETPSLARSLLVRRSCPILVLMDADSLNPDMIAEQREATEELIRAANGSVPVKVVTVVPEIEAWFFATLETLEHALGQAVSLDWLMIGKRDPKYILKLLMEKGQQTWNFQRAIDRLNDEDITAIRALPEVADITEFLTLMQRAEVAV